MLDIGALAASGGQFMTARAGGVGALVVVAVVAAVLVLGGGGAHQYKLLFANAGQLVKDNDVQIGGRRIGSIKKIELTKDNRAEITIQVKEPYSPLHEGTTAVIRGTSLSGIANRYIALSPGANNAPKLDDGTLLAEDKTTTIVDLDQIFNTLDGKTRDGLAQTIQGFATWYAGKGKQANGVARYFAPSLAATRNLSTQLAADQPALKALVSNTGRVVNALSARSTRLTDLVSNTNTALGAIASENGGLNKALALLPGTLRRGSSTFVDLRGMLDDLSKLVAAAKPATKNLAPFLRDLQPLLKDARPTVGQLAKLLQQPGVTNDLTDLLSDAPALSDAATPAFKNGIEALNKSLPVLSFIRPYTPDFVGWLRDFGQSAANYDANGHYARVQPIFNAFKYDDASNTLKPVPSDQRVPGLVNGATLAARCPGSAAQPPADGSAPWRDTSGTLDCNPSIVPPGR